MEGGVRDVVLNVRKIPLESWDWKTIKRLCTIQAKTGASKRSPCKQGHQSSGQRGGDSPERQREGQRVRAGDSGQEGHRGGQYNKANPSARVEFKELKECPVGPGKRLDRTRSEVSVMVTGES